MSLIHPATKYLWSARTESLITAIEASWGFTKRVTAAPARYYKRHWVGVNWIIVIGCVLGGVAAAIHHSMYQSDPADGARMAALMKADGCMDYTLRARYADSKDPVTNEQVGKTADDCKQWWIDQKVMQSQKQVLTPNK